LKEKRPVFFFLRGEKGKGKGTRTLITIWSFEEKRGRGKEKKSTRRPRAYISTPLRGKKGGGKTLASVNSPLLRK